MELLSGEHNMYHYLIRDTTGTQQTSNEHSNQSEAILLSMPGLEKNLREA